MSEFDNAGAANVPDAGGAGTPLVPPTPSGPLAGGPPPPSPSPEGPAPVDPRLEAVLRALQPAPQPTGFAAILSKVLPILAGGLAMHQNAGGAFAEGLARERERQQVLKDQEAQRQFRLFDIIHQQQQEQIAAERARQSDRRQFEAEQKLTAAAAQKKLDENNKLMRDEWSGVREGLIPVYNELLDSQGQDAADRYLQSTHIGALTDAGIAHTAKDLVDRYAVRSPDGRLIDGKVKTPKEVAAGSQEEAVIRARKMAETEMGRPLSPEEQAKVDQKTLKWYKSIKPEDDTTAAYKQLQLEMGKMHKELLQQQIDRGYQDKYGSAPQYFQTEDGKIHGYVYDKTANRTVEIPVDIPEGVTKIQPPSAWKNFINMIWGDNGAPAPATATTPNPKDPNWGKH